MKNWYELGFTISSLVLIVLSCCSELEGLGIFLLVLSLVAAVHFYRCMSESGAEVFNEHR